MLLFIVPSLQLWNIQWGLRTWGGGGKTFQTKLHVPQNSLLLSLIIETMLWCRIQYKILWHNNLIFYLGHFYDEMSCCLRSFCRAGVRVYFLWESQLKDLHKTNEWGVRNECGVIRECEVKSEWEVRCHAWLIVTWTKRNRKMKAILIRGKSKFRCVNTW